MNNCIFYFSFVRQLLSAKLGVGTGSSGLLSASSETTGFGAERGRLTWRGSSGLIKLGISLLITMFCRFD